VLAVKDVAKEAAGAFKDQLVTSIGTAADSAKGKIEGLEIVAGKVGLDIKGWTGPLSEAIGSFGETKTAVDGVVTQVTSV
jgi:hypothetical protein